MFPTLIKFESISCLRRKIYQNRDLFLNNMLAYYKLRQNCNLLLLDTNYYILGDQAYPLSRYLLESYPKRGLNEVYFKKSPIALLSVLILNLQSRKLFNRTLNSVRSSIERLIEE
jgi:hypothetical protein